MARPPFYSEPYVTFPCIPTSAAGSLPFGCRVYDRDALL